MNNKKTILHFTLAVGLIVGICATAKLRPSSSGASNYLSNFKDIEHRDDESSVSHSAEIKETGINDIPDNSTMHKKNPNELEVSCKNCEKTDTKDTYVEKTIAEIRNNFNVSSSEEVKEVQKILGLEQDGIFGPKTSAAYQAAIYGETASDAYAKDKSKEKEERTTSTTNAMLD